MEIWYILATLGVISFAIEIFTSGFILGSVGVGFLLSAGGSYLSLEVKYQILLFSLGVILTYFLLGPIIRKYGYLKQSIIKMNKEALIDRRGIVVEEISMAKNTGRIRIDGDEWKAVIDGDQVFALGASVRVISIENSVLLRVELFK